MVVGCARPMLVGLFYRNVGECVFDLIMGRIQLPTETGREKGEQHGRKNEARCRSHEPAKHGLSVTLRPGSEPATTARQLLPFCLAHASSDGVATVFVGTNAYAS